MTADNIGTDAAIGRKLGSFPDINFDHTRQVHGCVAHVINLAAKEGLKEFGEVMDIEDDVHPSNSMNVRRLVDPPDVHNFNLKTIYARCHGLVKATRSSPQRAQSFANIVTAVRHLANTLQTEPIQTEPTGPGANTNTNNHQVNDDVNYMIKDINNEDHQPAPQSRDGAANRLVPDVPTRWNSSYHMFRRMLRLRQACDEFCKSRDFKKFALLPAEWDYVHQMCDFLEPLSAATEMLCRSKFPTMQQVVPMYIVVIQGLKSVSPTNFFYIIIN